MNALQTWPLGIETAHEVKFSPLGLKEIGLDGVFEGYASLFNREDLGREPASPTIELVARIRRAGAVINQEPGSARIPGPGLPLDPPRSRTEHRL